LAKDLTADVSDILWNVQKQIRCPFYRNSMQLWNGHLARFMLKKRLKKSIGFLPSLA
jgi:hypothetical protein